MMRLEFEATTLQPLFDHSLLSRRITGKRSYYETLPFLQDIAGDIYLRLAPIKRDFETALSVFPPASSFREALLASGKIGTLDEKKIENVEDNGRTLENLQLPEAGYDLIFSGLGLQFANDLPGVLVQIQRALKPGGFFLACLAGGETLKEMREAFTLAETETTGGASPRLHPAIDVKQMGSLLQRAQFIEPITDVEKYTFSYDEPLDLLKDLVSWSPGNLLLQRSRKPLRRATLMRFDKIYREKFGLENKKVKASFELIWCSGWKSET